MCLRNLRKSLVIFVFLFLSFLAGLSAEGLDPKTMTDLELVERLVQNYQKQDEILEERQKTLEELKSQLNSSQTLSLTLQTRLSDLESSMTCTKESIERTQNSLTSFSEEYEQTVRRQNVINTVLTILLIISSATALTAIVM